MVAQIPFISCGTIAFIFMSCFIIPLCLGANTPVTLFTGGPYCFDDRGNYTSNSTYQKNLDSVFRILTSQASKTHFYNATVGSGVDKVYALYYCRYDLSLDVCDSCIKEATKTVVQYCPNQKEAIIPYLECSLRYANRSIFSKMELWPGARWGSKQRVFDGGALNQTLNQTMVALTQIATSGETSIRYFATGGLQYSTEPQNLSCLVLCTPDITPSECKTCLETALKFTFYSVAGQTWGMVFLVSCHMRYNQGPPFYNLTTTRLPSIVPTPPTLPDNSTHSTPNLRPSHGGSRQTIPTYTAGTLAAFLMVTVTWLLSGVAF